MAVPPHRYIPWDLESDAGRWIDAGSGIQSIEGDRSDAEAKRSMGDL